ncbi:MAG: ATP-binding cassette domain-containing protein [Thermodesulfobacteriota bacterium]
MISIQGLDIDLRDFHLRDINLDVAENEFFILMGPTGAGKTVLLEAIVGLVPIKNGTIYIHGRDITALPPEKRGIGIVYQDYALFPNLTVMDNVTYGLHFHKIDKRKAQERLSQLLEVLNLSHLQHRFPVNLSGGEKQRVSVARALMVEPKVLLLDEPLSALDPGFREEVRGALKRLHQTSDTTFLMVTHDFAEALSLAGRAAVMNNGRIEQAGEIEDIFKRPNSAFVADFVGMKNLFRAEFKGTKALVSGLEIELGVAPTNSHGYIAIRPEDIVISKRRFSSSMRNSFPAVVTAIIDQGFYYEVRAQSGETGFASLITKSSLIDLKLRETAHVVISFKATAVHFF